MNLYDIAIARKLSGGGGGGSSDFSTAEVTVSAESAITAFAPIVNTQYNAAMGSLSVTTTPQTVAIMLYKGNATVWSGDMDVVSVTGDAELDDGEALVTGDCSITFGNN